MIMMKITINIIIYKASSTVADSESDNDAIIMPSTSLFKNIFSYKIYIPFPADRQPLLTHPINDRRYII